MKSISLGTNKILDNLDVLFFLSKKVVDLCVCLCVCGICVCMQGEQLHVKLFYILTEAIPETMAFLINCCILNVEN